MHQESIAIRCSTCPEGYSDGRVGAPRIVKRVVEARERGSGPRRSLTINKHKALLFLIILIVCVM